MTQTMALYVCTHVYISCIDGLDTRVILHVYYMYVETRGLIFQVKSKHATVSLFHLCILLLSYA